MQCPMEKEDRFADFTISVARLNKWLQKTKSDAMKAYDLKGAHVLCLYRLEQKQQGSMFSEIVKNCDFDRAFASRILRELNDRGLVYRDGEEGKYKALYFLTNEGKTLMPKLHSIINRVQARIDEGISEADLVVYYRVVDRMLHNMEQISAEADTVLTAE